MEFNLNVMKNRIEEIAIQSSGNISSFLREYNLPKSLLDNIKKGSIPAVDKIFYISQISGVSSDYILGLSDEKWYSCNRIYRFPIYDQNAAAGAGILGRDGNYHMEEIISDTIPDSAIFGIRINGESMSPEIPNHSIVLINPNVDEYTLDGKNVIAVVDGDVICKQYLRNENGIYFKSLNRQYKKDDRFVVNDNYSIIGEVVKIQNLE